MGRFKPPNIFYDTSLPVGTPEVFHRGSHLDPTIMFNIIWSDQAVELQLSPPIHLPETFTGRA